VSLSKNILRVNVRRRWPFPEPDVITDPVESAHANGLRHVGDTRPGIRRLKTGSGFRYRTEKGNAVRDPAVLARVKSLAIPPAWTDVWISPLANGHLQATGRDARGRKQYRYHPQWRAIRDESKFNRLLAFASALPEIRRRVDRDLQLPRLSRNKVLAAVVRLLEVTLIRVGNEEYVRQNRSFGLTTMRDNHVMVSGPTIRFEFQGKGGKRHTIDVNDRRLARIVRTCREIPGQDLFQYLDDRGKRHDVTSGDVNDYLREIAGEDFTAKDFRTWAGTLLAAVALMEFEKFDPGTRSKKNILRAIEHVAGRLGNTPSICRKCYIHPAVFEAYLDGMLIQVVRQRAEDQMIQSVSKLRPEEAAVLGLLQQRLARAASASGN
jgi:DNA topoisomerase I